MAASNTNESGTDTLEIPTWLDWVTVGIGALLGIALIAMSVDALRRLAQEEGGTDAGGTDTGTAAG